MTSSPHPTGEARRTRSREAGVGRPAGMLIAAVTAAAVFVIGRPFIPRPVPPGPGGPMTEVAPPPAVPPPIAATDAQTATDAGTAGSAVRAADGGESQLAGAAADGGPPKAETERTATDAASPREPTHAEEEAKPGAAESKPGAEAEEKSEPSEEKKPEPAGAVTAADKDIAHAAWRANRPDVRVSGSRSTLIVPLKGSVRDGTFKFFPKTRVVAIVLPHAASLNTMHFYRLRRHGFRTLWTFQDESNARASDGTKIRIKLDVDSPPQVELHDDFIRVVIARPGSGKETSEAKDDDGAE